ncbi:MAG TPA: GGDEF domain-containing protein [Burkholderiaceae bacterium]|jgi:diguanylate cyclase (GGDEF)-like protein
MHDTSNFSRSRDSKAKARRSKEEIILLLLCGLSVPSILPFGIFRLLQHNWLAASVDLMLVGGMTCVMLYVWNTGRIRFASLAVTIFYSTGMLITVNLQGVGVVYWAYPTMIAGFFMLRPNVALAINFVSLAIIVALLSERIPVLTLMTIAVTIALINLFSYIFSQRTRLQHTELNLAAEHDHLTGTGNRRALERKLAGFLRTGKSDAPSSMLLLDLDHFKEVNDRFGHAAGDKVLVQLCELIRSRTRRSDEIFRYGGEEFIVIANGASLRAASGMAETLRALVAATNIINGCPITVSIGVAAIEEGELPDAWLLRADRMLYQAKQTGRNKVCVAE